MLLFTVLLFAFAVTDVEGLITRVVVEIGKEATYSFGEGNFLIKRFTKASSNPQYLFASSNQDGTWTTDGTDKIPSSANLSWNGTLTFKSITKNDIGSYEMPLKLPSVPFAAESFVVEFELAGS
uniref:Uncharacterized protein n=1 Tax=Panagrolaimus sp. PS1159 TaxID=55785 RepID=A0AC35F7B9_9BILA